jgi:hypothetical protein
VLPRSSAFDLCAIEYTADRARGRGGRKDEDQESRGHRLPPAGSGAPDRAPFGKQVGRVVGDRYSPIGAARAGSASDGGTVLDEIPILAG